MIVLHVHKLQYIIRKCAFCCFVMWSHIASGFSLGREWRYRYRTMINYPTKLLAEIEVLLFILHS